MKIVRLTAANVKRLAAVEIEPDGNVVEIRGNNAQGKTSVMDSIAAALGGKALCPKDPIRHGESTASVTVDLGEYVVTREFTKKSTTLRVESANGAVYKSPQAILDKLVGSLTFDPLEFSRKKSADQREALLGLLGLREQLDTLDAEENGAYENRRLANKQAKASSAAAMCITVPDKTPEQPISVAELTAELNQAIEQKHANDEKRRGLEECKQDCGRLWIDIETMQGRVAEARTHLAELEQAEKQLRATYKDECKLRDERTALVDSLADPDTDAIQARIATAEETNAHVARLRERRKHEQEAEQREREAAMYDDAVQGVRDKRRKLLDGAAWPVDGLGFADGSVTYNGVLFEQCSSAEQLRVSLAIAMEMNPKLRVLLIRDGSLLDDDSLRTIYETVGERDYQLWIERVGDDGQASIVIEDGQVRDNRGDDSDGDC